MNCDKASWLLMRYRWSRYATDMSFFPLSRTGALRERQQCLMIREGPDEGTEERKEERLVRLTSRGTARGRRDSSRQWRSENPHQRDLPAGPRPRPADAIRTRRPATGGRRQGGHKRARTHRERKRERKTEIEEEGEEKNLSFCGRQAPGQVGGQGGVVLSVGREVAVGVVGELGKGGLVAGVEEAILGAKRHKSASNEAQKQAEK